MVQPHEMIERMTGHAVRKDASVKINKVVALVCQIRMWLAPAQVVRVPQRAARAVAL